MRRKGLKVEEKHKLQQLIDNLIERDKRMLDEMNSMFGGGPTLENQLVLANARAEDALSALCLLARYVMERESKAGEPATEPHNAKLCGAEPQAERPNER